MTNAELVAKLEELQELKRLAEDVAADIEAAQDEIKAYMTANTLDTFTAGAFKVSWKEVTTTRIDSTALKKALPAVAAQYSKTTTTRRFTVN